jgi:prepilin-type N-terminal cleavage/methylation domain-containing protein
MNIKLLIRQGSARSRGLTLIETMVGLAVGSFALAGAAAVIVGGSFSFAAMGNYVGLDKTSSSALDQMTRDIRRSANLQSFSANLMVFNYSGTTTLTYSYDAIGQQLLSWKSGGPTNVLLTGCDYLQFAMYSSAPAPGGNLTNTTSLSQGKAIGVNWHCYRTIRGQQRSTEDMQEAVIVIRNKPVS